MATQEPYGKHEAGDETATARIIVFTLAQIDRLRGLACTLTLPETALPLLLGEALMSNSSSFRGKAGMFPRCLVVCTLILLGSLAGAAQSSPDVFRFGRNIVLAPDQRFHNAGCFLCSADVEGQGTGSVRVVRRKCFSQWVGGRQRTGLRRQPHPHQQRSHWRPGVHLRGTPAS